MKLIITLLSSFAIADSSPAGTVSDNNDDCSKRCFNSQWTIEGQNGDCVFVCDPETSPIPPCTTQSCVEQAPSAS
jgi:hypothetical protein